MELLLLTGMSGSGKSKVKEYLEDMGYFCVDNVPFHLLKNLSLNFYNATQKNKESLPKVAFIVDARSLNYFSSEKNPLAEKQEIFEHIVALKELEKEAEYKLKLKIIFLETSTEVLVSRYKQTRRTHPLSDGRGLFEAIEDERIILADLKNQADHIVDSSNYSNADLRNYIYDLLSNTQKESRMTVYVVSFGFKYGLPVDCDLLEDMRFLPNPYYDKNLRQLSGLDPEVQEFLFNHEISQKYLSITKQRLALLLPAYLQEGKVRLTLGVGCTGGRHRSVAFSIRLAEYIQELGYSCRLFHRDLQKDPYNINKIEDYRKTKSEKQ